MKREEIDKLLDDVTSKYSKRKHEKFIKNSDEFLENLGKHIGHDLSPEARRKYNLAQEQKEEK